MSTSRLRQAIIVLTTITALIHLVLLNLGGLDLLFLLNGIGYFVLLWALVVCHPRFRSWNAPLGLLSLHRVYFVDHPRLF